MLPGVPRSTIFRDEDNYNMGIFAGLYLSEGCVNGTCIKISVLDDCRKLEVQHILNVVSIKTLHISMQTVFGYMIKI